jgi:hypothetical protein
MWSKLNFSRNPMSQFIEKNKVTPGPYAPGQISTDARQSITPLDKSAYQNLPKGNEHSCRKKGMQRSSLSEIQIKRLFLLPDVEKFLPPASSQSLRFTNKEFKSVGTKRINKVSIHDATNIELQEEIFRRSPDIHTICINGQPDFNNQQLGQLLVRCAAHDLLITHLDLRGCRRMNNETLKILCQQTQLKSLHLSGCDQINDDGLIHFRKMSQLELLDLHDCKYITNNGLPNLKELTQLRSLNLSGNFFVTQLGLPALSDLINMQSLDLSGCRYLEGAGLEHLNKMTELEHLNLAECFKVGDDDVIHIPHQKLKSLNLSGCTRLTDQGFAAIGQFTQLASLDLSMLSENLTNSGMAQLRGLINLESLNITQANLITGEAMIPLAQLNKLKHIEMPWCDRFGNDGVEELAKHTTLETLDISACEKIRNKGLAALRGHPNLQKLRLAYCEHITDAGVLHVQTIEKLHVLNLNNCRRVSARKHREIKEKYSCK